jgi:hypothetical protein
MKNTNLKAYFLETAVYITCFAVTLAPVQASADVIELDEAFIYLEMNASGPDLGIHSILDGEAWDRMKIQGTDSGRTLLNVWGRGNLGMQGLTELFFESDEPEIPEDITVNEVLDRAPEGTYTFTGFTIENDRLSGEWTLSHTMAATAEPEVTVNGAVWVCTGLNPTADMILSGRR